MCVVCSALDFRLFTVGNVLCTAGTVSCVMCTVYCGLQCVLCVHCVVGLSNPTKSRVSIAGLAANMMATAAAPTAVSRLFDRSSVCSVLQSPNW